MSSFSCPDPSLPRLSKWSLNSSQRWAESIAALPGVSLPLIMLIQVGWVLKKLSLLIEAGQEQG